MHSRQPYVERLPYHLQNCQTVYYHDHDSPEAIAGRSVEPTKLTAWFQLNRDDEDALDMKYCDIPTHYKWDAATKVGSDGALL